MKLNKTTLNKNDLRDDRKATKWQQLIKFMLKFELVQTDKHFNKPICDNRVVAFSFLGSLFHRGYFKD